MPMQGASGSCTTSALYDYYDKRVDYGDGEFPSKWPPEIKQDEMDGWGLRVYPRRQPVEVSEPWEKYVDANTGKVWFYNKQTEASSYVCPVGVGFQSDANARPSFAPSSADDSPMKSGLNDWAKYYDETQVSGRDGWEKFVDSQSGYPYYYNRFTMESTSTRPFHFQTARRGDVTMELGSSDWAKYYDVSQGMYYYYNFRTYESAFARPFEFTTPRIVSQDTTTVDMTEFYDPATGKAYFYNTRTSECQLAVVSSSPKARNGVRDYR